MSLHFFYNIYSFVRYIVLTFFIFVITVTFSYANDENDTSYLRDLEATAQDFLKDQIELGENEILDFEVQPINSKKEISICEGELNLSIASGKIRKNNTIKIQCVSQTTPFSVYVVIKAVIKRPYVTVTENVPKDTVLTQELLTINYMDKFLDKGTSFNQIEPLIGIKTKRNLRPGQAIQKNQICVVCNGSLVTIEARNSLLSVKTDGQVLQDGSFNDKIKVKNLKSGKIVQATVVNSNLVVIDLN